MIFERNPENRINVSELKRRIFECPRFSAPLQQLPSPPMSPLSPPADEYESVSDDGSIMSDEGSLTGSCSTLSDSDSEGSDSYDSGYDSREGSPEMEDQQCFQACQNNIPPANTSNRVAPQHIQRPANPAPFLQQRQQAYVLPSQGLQGSRCGHSSKLNPYFATADWGNSYANQFQQTQAIYVHPAAAGYSYYPTYSQFPGHHQLQPLQCC